jgi:hypothetical protein
MRGIRRRWPIILGFATPASVEIVTSHRGRCCFLKVKTLATEGGPNRIPAMASYEYILIGVGLVLIIAYFIIKKNQKQ